MGAAAQAWRDALEAWAIPRHILDAAPSSPWGFDPGRFGSIADAAIALEHDEPSHAAARAALPAGGTVLDVGAGAGAGSLRLADRAGRLVAFDASRPLLEEFATRARMLAVEHMMIEGRWPDDHEVAPRVDVVVCHNVFYNATDLDAFARALDEHATRRVVIELTAEHPLAWLQPYWQTLHRLERPSRPTVDDARAVLDALGFEVEERRWSRGTPLPDDGPDGLVDRLARRLCLPSDRHDELAALLQEVPPPDHREVVALWWDTPS